MKAATQAAMKRARKEGTCYKPAWLINDCKAVEGGVACRADSANHQGSCNKRDWFRPAGSFPDFSILIPVYPLPVINSNNGIKSDATLDWEEDFEEDESGKQDQ
jgi:hypothetical protein